jgi:uncharacterized protein YidB (DUF937 family)
VVAGKLSEVLPKTVDKMTPDGTVPDGGFNMDDLSKVLGGLTGNK